MAAFCVFVKDSPSFGIGLQVNESNSKYIKINRNIKNQNKIRQQLDRYFKELKIIDISYLDKLKYIITE